MVFNSFAAGRKVYGQGSYAPNRGQVSAQGAQGYLQREIRKPQAPNKLFKGVSTFGRDGQSDTRSGAAASMLANRKAGGNNNTPGVAVGEYNPGGPKLPNTDNGNGNGNGQNFPPGGGPGPVGTPPNTAPGGGGVPTVEIGADGTLHLPYDGQWSASVLSGLQSMNNQLLDLQFSQQDQALEFARANRDADLEYTDVKRGTLGANAQGGTAFSSQYGTSVGENARAYGTYKNDLLLDNNIFNQRTEMERLAIQNAFNEMLRQDAIRRAEEAVANGDGSGGTPGGGGNGNGDDKKGGGKKWNGGEHNWDPKDHKPPKNEPTPIPRDPIRDYNGPKGHKGPKIPKPPQEPNTAQRNALAYLKRKAR